MKTVRTCPNLRMRKAVPWLEEQSTQFVLRRCSWMGCSASQEEYDEIPESAEFFQRLTPDISHILSVFISRGFLLLFG